jgi:hypothetical protein
VVDLEEGERVALHGATGVERRYLSAYDTDERGLRTDDPTAKVRQTMNEGTIETYNVSESVEMAFSSHNQESRKIRRHA